MGLVFITYLGILRFAKWFGNTGFAKIFASAKRSFRTSAALLIGGDTVHVVVKTGRGIQDSGENSGSATIDRRNDQFSTNVGFEAKTVTVPSDVDVHPCKEIIVEADEEFKLRDGCQSIQKEGHRPDPPAAEVPRVVPKQSDLPRRPDPPVVEDGNTPIKAQKEETNMDNYPKITDHFQRVAATTKEDGNYLLGSNGKEEEVDVSCGTASQSLRFAAPTNFAEHPVRLLVWVPTLPNLPCCHNISANSVDGMACRTTPMTT